MHSSSSLETLLAPEWEPNDVIKMFHEERARIEHRAEECRHLLNEVNSVHDTMQSLQKLYQYVSPRTNQLHSECRAVIQERNELKESYDKIKSTLSEQEELRNMFKRLPDVKNQILSILNNVSQSFQVNSNDPQHPLDEYYGRFYIECRRIKDLTNQLESCLSESKSNDLMLHLEEIYSVYFDIREQLMERVLNVNLDHLISKADRNYCDLLRQTSSSLIRIIRNEIQLFEQIFPPFKETATLKESTVKKQALKIFLELLCKIFYDHLRPVVIHINHIETLTELYKLILDTIKPELSQDFYQQMMISLSEDVQERMLFRAEIYMQESVLNYKPSSGDLAYPEKLEVVRGELKDYQSMWYPTLQRTTMALFYLNQVFDRLTFQDLAEEVVIACLKSLDVAQRLIDERHGGTKIEASLFWTKHSGILKDQLKSYGIDKDQLIDSWLNQHQPN